MFLDIISGFNLLFSIDNFIVMFLGIIIGMILGAIPGLTGIMAIALIVPFTYYMPPVPSLILLLAVSKGALYGGSIPAILINTPGTPAAAATTLDGYPLALQGKAIKALKIALYSSVSADAFSDIMLILVAASLAKLAIKFGPTEYSVLIIFSFTVIIVVSSEFLMKGIVSALFGLFLGVIGIDPVVGVLRLNFGHIELYQGLPLLSLMIGIFALSEIFGQLEKKLSKETTRFMPISKNIEDHKVTKKDFLLCWKHVLRASIIGTILGALPGIGPTISSFVSYGEAKRTSKHPELFGKGSIEGVAASEAGNSAVCGANLIPLLSLGIPGDATAAVLLGAFMLQGLSPGPLLFEKHGPIMYAFFIGLFLCNLVNLFVGSIAIRLSKPICNIRKEYIYPLILLFCCIGSYSFNNSLFDVKIMFLFGIIGYFMNKFGFPISPLVIAFVLEPIGELSIRQALISFNGNIFCLFTRPIPIFFWILTILSIVFSLRKRKSIVEEKTDFYE